MSGLKTLGKILLVIVVFIGAIILVSGVRACYNHRREAKIRQEIYQRPGQSYFNKYQRAAQEVADELALKGLVVLVTIRDWDGNGILDYVVEYQGGARVTVAELLGAVTGAVARVSRKTDWRSDKAVVIDAYSTWAAYTSNCRACYRKFLDYRYSDYEVGACILSIWVKRR